MLLTDYTAPALLRRYSYAFVVLLLLFSVAACLKPRERTNQTCVPSATQTCPPATPQCVPTATQTCPSTGTQLTTQNLSSTFRYKILQNGSNTHEDFVKAKEENPKDLLAPAHLKTLWKVQLENTSGHVFRSKLLTPEIAKIKFAAKENHTWEGENYFNSAGTTTFKFQAIPLQNCKTKYTESQCNDTNFWPTDSTLVAAIDLPVRVIDIGLNPDPAACDLISDTNRLISRQTPGNTLTDALLGVVANQMKADRNCADASTTTSTP